MRSSATLPDVSAPSLVLTHPTPEEKKKTWALHHTMWGQALSLEDYLHREEYLTTVPLAKDGGVTHWILTDDSPPNQRPILSSCESLRKRALVCQAGVDGGKVQDAIGHGIFSVFTDPQYRGKGYASRMMKELNPTLARWPPAGSKDVNGHAMPNSRFSVLYSDIGKAFYAKSGWAPFESSHLAFPPVARAEGGSVSGAAKPLGYHELAELCAVDEKLLRIRVQKRAHESKDRRPSAALVPDLDQMLWHLMREDFMTKRIFGKTPTIRGAVYGEAGKRLWAVWIRGYYGGIDKVEGNTLFILRFAVEDETASEDYLAEGFRSVIEVAQAEAAEWRIQEAQMWNPTPLLRQVVAKAGLQHEFVDRDTESIASLAWYGEAQTSDIDWVANEKFGWC